MTIPSSISRVSFLLLLACGLVVVTGCDNAGSNGDSGTTYTASLSALNSSGVSGTADVTVRDGQFTVTVDAEGTEASQVHFQHIHGFDDQASACPTMSADSDGNGRISVSEGAPAYGGIRVPLDGSLDTAGESNGLGDGNTMPTADGSGAYMYEESIATGDLALNGGGSFSDLNLDQHAIVVHGLTVDGTYEATLPVACGTLSAE